MLPLSQPPRKNDGCFDDWMFRLWKRATNPYDFTLVGTAGKTYTFPTTSATLARTDAGQTFAGVQNFTSPAITTNITTPSISFDVFNTTATTVNAFGAATTLSIGAATGTLTLNNAAIKIATGSVSAPSIYFSTDTTSGLYRIGSNSLGIAISGEKIFSINDSSSWINCATSSQKIWASLDTGEYKAANANFITITKTTTGTGEAFTAFNSLTPIVTSAGTPTFTGTYSEVLRSDAADVGNIAAIIGNFTNFGHYTGTPAGATTTTAIGQYSSLYQKSGTITSAYHFKTNVIAGGSAVVNHYGYWSSIVAATGRWEFYAQGGANNAFAGNTRFGGVTVPAATVDITGGIAFTTTMSAAAGSVSAPSIYWGTDTGTGPYRIGANNTGWAVSGSKVLDIASTGLGVTGNLTATTTIKTGGYTVAGLPTPAVGMRTYVTDALAPVFGAVVAAGGAVTIPVFYDGANWIVG